MVQGFSREPGTHGPVTTPSPAGIRKITWWAAAIAVGGFLFGFDTGVVSGALLYIRDDFGLNSFQQGSVVSVLLIGSVIGAMGAGKLADRWGRRRLLGVAGGVFLAGTAVAVFATGYGMLLTARIVLGLAVGTASALVPVYLSEISPTEIRGRLLTMNQLMITVGILVAYLVNLVFADGGDWRAMFACGAVPALVLVVAAAWFLPESPQWQIEHGRAAEARDVIASVSDPATADRIVERVQRRITDDRAKRPASGNGSGSGSGSGRGLWAPDFRPALVLGLTLAAVQQFGGINTIIYYAPTIIEQTGLSASNSIFYSVAIGAINLLMTLVAIKLVDRVGRRPMVLVSLAVMAVSVFLLGLAFVADFSSGLTLLFMVVYIAAFAGGLGPVFWTLIGEIFPPSVRAEGSSASTAVNWVSNFIVSLAFLPLANVLGQGETFWIFAGICALAFVFVSRFLPETRGRGPEEIERDLDHRFGRDPNPPKTARVP
ncbi:sugar porter family MFS transporter [Streptomyces sp. R302]|uniref:sugar porter family MFS transporter n=1 Tax=unclassified Streptomyces TaxID=2593676 RepID=UPI00145FC72B|nr:MULTISPECIES: sugar porter family MFS transporter [unclassified Streptomyces]NML54096.1 sugar porter family MFS transporter [Streptomyces sp. R301]NML83356.1 sugar porter family MFS transporter [Streptomyces sp. R302]